MPLTEDFTFRMGTTGIILNSSSSTPFVDIEKVTGLDNAEYRTTTRDWEGNDGSFIDAEFEKARTVVLDGTVYANSSTAESYLDNLKEDYAPSRTLQQFFIKAAGVNERFLYVKPLGCRYDWDTLRRLGMTSIQISLYAEDPRLYDSTLNSLSFAQGAQIFTGFGFDLGFSFGFGGITSTTDTVILNNGGNRPTPFVFTMNGPVVNPRLISDTTSSELMFNIELLTGDTLTVDTKYKTVYFNGNQNKRATLNSPDWFFLQPGDNQLRYRAESAGGSTVSLQYYSAWR